jgi:Zn finger protein HypA/HybF involved in hydrogenase expression
MARYKITSDIITAHITGIVEADTYDEAVEKFQSGDVVGELDEEPTREETNIEVEEIERWCTKCGRTSNLKDEEDICETCAKERGR